MGVHVILDIDPRGIDEAEWAATYDATLALLSAWQPRLLGWGWRRRVCWSVVGDRDTLHEREMRELGELAAKVRAEGGA
jgi:hypothetical protein